MKAAACRITDRLLELVEDEDPRVALAAIQAALPYSLRMVNALETQKAIEEELDIHSKTEIVETNRARIRVKDTDLGLAIQKQIDDLQRLLSAYRAGLIKEK